MRTIYVSEEHCCGMIVCIHTCMDQYACIPHYVVLASSVQMTKVGPGPPCWEGSPWLVVPVECLFGKKDVLLFVV